MGCNVLMLLLCIGIFIVVSGQTLNHSKTLMRDILSGYDKRHRPIFNQSAAIQVNVSFDIIALQDFDEVDEKFSVGGLLNMAWVDETVTWNPSLYGGITSQLYQLTDIWFPVLALGNPYETTFDVIPKWMTVRYHYNGIASFNPGALFKATCSVDVTYYPFDTQMVMFVVSFLMVFTFLNSFALLEYLEILVISTLVIGFDCQAATSGICHLVFTAWGYSLEEVTLFSSNDRVLQTYYTENGEWTIISTSAEVMDRFIYFRFTLERKPLFLVVNVLLPMIFMACINIFTFLLPEESGERISYSVTCLLAIAVFLTLVSDNLPRRSQPMSIMCYYLTIVLVLSVLICCLAIFNLKIYFKDSSNSVPTWCERIVRKKCRNKRGHREDFNNTIYPVMIDPDDAGSTSKCTKKDDSQKMECPRISWRDVSDSVNRICVITFSFLIFIVTGAFIIILAANS